MRYQSLHRLRRPTGFEFVNWRKKDTGQMVDLLMIKFMQRAFDNCFDARNSRGCHHNYRVILGIEASERKLDVGCDQMRINLPDKAWPSRIDRQPAAGKRLVRPY